MVEANYNANMPFKWNAFRIQLIQNDAMASMGSSQQTPAASTIGSAPDASRRTNRWDPAPAQHATAATNGASRSTGGTAAFGRDGGDYDRAPRTRRDSGDRSRDGYTDRSRDRRASPPRDRDRPARRASPPPARRACEQLSHRASQFFIQLPPFVVRRHRRPSAPVRHRRAAVSARRASHRPPVTASATGRRVIDGETFRC